LYYNFKEKNINFNINDEDYINMYNYKMIHKRDIEDPLFTEENEKYYYNYLKIFFLKENFYDILIKDNYIKFLHYNNFISNLKKKVFLNKCNKNKDLKFRYLIKNNFFLDLSDNIKKIENELLNNIYFKK